MPETSNDNWFYEYFTPDAKFGIKIRRHLVDTKSEFQKIDFYDSYEYGRFFTLDGYIMLTQRDEFIYHEMIAHVPMAVRPDAKKALIIGGGDGGTARELLRYSTIQHIDMVEIDRMVVNLCRQFMPFTACSLDDPRLNIHYTDGVAFVAQSQQKYDLILVDSTDPIGVGEGLFGMEFYQNCKNLLAESGILVNQHESPYYEDDARQMMRAHAKLDAVFGIAAVYQFHMPTYASGHWLFGFASDSVHPTTDIKEDQWNSLGIATKYYNTALHKGCFALPNYVQELLKNTGMQQ